MGAAQTGFIIMAIAFPLYLLWKGELPSYLTLATSGAASDIGGTGTTTLQQSTGTIQVPTVGGIPVPPIQTTASPGTM